MLETEEAILRVAHKLCTLDMANPCPQPCAKHSAEARFTVYTLLDAAADAEDVPSPEGFSATKAAITPQEMNQFTQRRKTYNVELKDVLRGYSIKQHEVLTETTDSVTADLVSSEAFSGRRRRFRRPVPQHYPMFDLDLECALIPSMREGHFHLYINKATSWRKYKRILRAMYKAGIIEKRWYKMCTRRGMATLWMPERKSKLLAIAQKDSYGWKREQKVRYLGS